MTEIALLSAFIVFFQNLSLKVLLGGKLIFLLLLCSNPLFFRNTTHYLDTASFRYLWNGPAAFL